jgi:hypothetical protein
MRRRSYLATTALALGLAGCASEDGESSGDGGDGGGEQPATTEGEATETQTEQPTETVQAAGTEAMDFSGSGTDTTDNFELVGGATVVDFEHSGESNFIVELLAVEGEDARDTVLVNQIGSVAGGTAVGVQPGTYRMNIDADGDWSITLAQPQDVDPASLPVKESGSGPTYIDPIEFESGVTEFTGSHSGDSNFIVETVPLEPGDLGMAVGTVVFNETGEFEGQTSERIENVGYVNINADGEWSLEIKSA